jgi:hypothetical protein
MMLLCFWLILSMIFLWVFYWKVKLIVFLSYLCLGSPAYGLRRSILLNIIWTNLKHENIFWKSIIWNKALICKLNFRLKTSFLFLSSFCYKYNYSAIFKLTVIFFRPLKDNFNWKIHHQSFKIYLLIKSKIIIFLFICNGQ